MRNFYSGRNNITSVNLSLFKQTFPRALAVFFAVLVSHYYFLSESFWMVLTTILVVWTPMGNVIERAVQRYLWIGIGAVVGAVCARCVFYPGLNFIIVTSVVGFCCYFQEEIIKIFLDYRHFFVRNSFCYFFFSGSEASCFLYGRIFDITLGRWSVW